MIQINFKKCILRYKDGVAFISETEDYPHPWQGAIYIKNTQITIRDGLAHLKGDKCQERKFLHAKFDKEEKFSEFCKNNDLDEAYAKRFVYKTRFLHKKFLVFNPGANTDVYTTKFYKIETWFNNFYIKQ